MKFHLLLILLLSISFSNIRSIYSVGDTLTVEDQSLEYNVCHSDENYIRDIIEQHYPEEAMLGDINLDTVVNIQDIILLINFILSQEFQEIADINFDSNVDILDVVLLMNIILQN